uniref:hypothetical protein n=1 Tax=Bartonella sp. CL42QHWL TaxID=3243528 RepID=UPI0035D012FA
MNTYTSIPEYVTSKSGKRYRLRVLDDNSRGGTPEYVTSKSGKRYRLRVLDDASNFEETTSPQHPEITQSEAFWNS